MILIVLIVLFISIYIVFNLFSKQPKLHQLETLFNTQSYFALVTSIEADDEYTANQFKAYTKDQGTVTFDNETNIPIAFDFKTQYIYKDSDKKWEIYLKDEKDFRYMPGSIESILNIQKADIDLNKFKEKTEVDRCEFLNIRDNCLGYTYETSKIRHEIYFKKDKNTLAYIRTTYNDGSLSTYIFSKVNDPEYRQAAEFFGTYKAEVEKDIKD